MRGEFKSSLHSWPVCSFPAQLQIGCEPRATGEMYACRGFFLLFVFPMWTCTSSVYLCIFFAWVDLSLHLTNHAQAKRRETGSGLHVVETVHWRACLATPAPLSNPSNTTGAAPSFPLHPLHTLLPATQYPQQRLWDLKEKQQRSTTADS